MVLFSAPQNFKNLNITSGQTQKCCDIGYVKLSEINGNFKQPNQPVLELYTGDSAQAKRFRENIVSYNRIFSTALPCGDIAGIGSRGHDAMVVNGALRYVPYSYRSSEHLSEVNPGQLYFVELSNDVAAARIACSTRGDTLDPNVVRIFENYLRNNNRFILQFVTAGERKRAEERLAALENRPLRDVTLAINPRPVGQTSYRAIFYQYRRYTLDHSYELPSNEFMAGLFVGDIGNINYDVRVFLRDRRPGECEQTMRPDRASLDLLK